MKNIFIIISLTLCSHSYSINETFTVGNTNFIHLINEDSIWWFQDHLNKKFITTGMNHVDEGPILFNEINKSWMKKKFGDDIQSSWGGLNPKATNISTFADMVVDDFKNYGFNTIPFHSYTVPLQLYEERKIYYIAKIKVQQICLTHMKRENGERFPDVFSSSFRNKLDSLAKDVCSPLKDAKYLIGYTFFDMPDLKSIRPFQKKKFKDKGLIYPWVQDLRALPAESSGKQKWIEILKKNHSDAFSAGQVYGFNEIESWSELSSSTNWPTNPNNPSLALKDAEEMFTLIAQEWYRLHHAAIKRYDPNHLILGDKHDVGYGNHVHKIPDGVLSAIGTFTDVLMIQSYTHYGAHHQLMLNELYEKCGIPIINGDHSFSCSHEHQSKTKGIQCNSQKEVANAYYTYMKNITKKHPFMLGWWHCGYIEQWAPAGSHLGQQCGFFSPFGEPRNDLLPLVKEANEKAVTWHQSSNQTE